MNGADHRTPLGQAVALITEYWQNPSHEIIRRLKPHLWKANQEAKELLEGDLSCALNLAGGAIGSAMTQNPLIMIWGVSECWMKVYGEPEVIHTIPDYQTKWNAVNYQISNETFRDTNGAPLSYSATLTNGKPLPHAIKFNGSTRTFSGTLGAFEPAHVRVFARDPQNAEVYTDFTIWHDGKYAMVIFLPIFALCMGVAFWLYKTKGELRCRKCCTSNRSDNHYESL